MAIEKGSKVSIHYKLTVDGETIDTSEGRDPLSFTHGASEIIPSLDSELAGMAVGDKKHVTITPENGYGNYRDEGLQKVPKDAFKDTKELAIGAGIVLQSPDGQPFQAVVKEIGDAEVTLDLNHPLAGKTLEFDVEIVGVEDAPSPIIKPD